MPKTNHTPASLLFGGAKDTASLSDIFGFKFPVLNSPYVGRPHSVLQIKSKSTSIVGLVLRLMRNGEHCSRNTEERVFCWFSMLMSGGKVVAKNCKSILATVELNCVSFSKIKTLFKTRGCIHFCTQVFSNLPTINFDNFTTVRQWLSTVSTNPTIITITFIK